MSTPSHKWGQNCLCSGWPRGSAEMFSLLLKEKRKMDIGAQLSICCSFALGLLYCSLERNAKRKAQRSENHLNIPVIHCYCIGVDLFTYWFTHMLFLLCFEVFLFRFCLPLPLLPQRKESILKSDVYHFIPFSAYISVWRYICRLGVFCLFVCLPFVVVKRIWHKVDHFKCTVPLFCWHHCHPSRNFFIFPSWHSVPVKPSCFSLSPAQVCCFFNIVCYTKMDSICIPAFIWPFSFNSVSWKYLQFSYSLKTM